MLKKSGIIALAILYSVTVLGFALNFHYCGNTVASVKIDSPAKNCFGDTAKKMKCCSDKQVDIKVKDAHQGESSHSLIARFFSLDIPALPFESFFFSAQTALIARIESRGPPKDTPEQSLAKYILHCTLRL